MDIIINMRLNYNLLPLLSVNAANKNVNSLLFNIIIFTNAN